jgi:hypothetical protein
MPRLIIVIESEDRRGRGAPGDPVRIVTQYHTPSGQMLAERDAFPPAPPEREEVMKLVTILREISDAIPHEVLPGDVRAGLVLTLQRYNGRE